MTDREHNKLSRNFRIQSFLSEHLPSLSAPAPALTGFVTQFNTAMDTIATHAKAVLANTTGYTIQQNNYRTLMEQQTLVVSGSMRAYFIATGNELNAEMATVSKSFLRNARQEISLVQCQNILTMATEHSAVIVPFGISAAMLSQLQTHVNNYNEVLTLSKFARKEKVAARKKLSETLVECDKILDIISGIMLASTADNDMLYLQFTYNMRIGKSGGGKGKKPDIEDEISAGEVALIADIAYNEKRSFKIRNKSKVPLKWGLSQSENDFTNPAHTLQPNATSQ